MSNFENERGFDPINWPVKKAIDLTPTWSSILPLLLHSVQITSKNKFVVEELERMAMAADKYNELMRNKK